MHGFTTGADCHDAGGSNSLLVRARDSVLMCMKLRTYRQKLDQVNACVGNVVAMPPPPLLYPNVEIANQRLLGP